VTFLLFTFHLSSLVGNMPTNQTTVNHQLTHPKSPSTSNKKFILQWKCLLDDSNDTNQNKDQTQGAKKSPIENNQNPKLSKNLAKTALVTINTWPCLQNEKIQIKAPETTTKISNPAKSFAQALTNICDTPQS